MNFAQQRLRGPGKLSSALKQVGMTGATGGMSWEAPYLEKNHTEHV